MDDKNLNSTNRTIYLLLCCFVLVGLLIYFLGDFDKNGSDMCSFHKKVFEATLDSAVVIRHFADKRNHAMRTVDIRSNSQEYTIYFIPYDNWADFDRLKPGDVIRKDKGTFEMKVNDDWTFRLRYDCSYPPVVAVVTNHRVLEFAAWSLFEAPPSHHRPSP